MTETQLFILVKGILDAYFTANGPVGVTVEQANQPRIAGRTEGASVLLGNQPMRRYGSLRRNDTWDGDTMMHTETQQMERTFQCGALLQPDPTSPTTVPGFTAGDLVLASSQALQSDVGLLALQTAGVQIYRITDIRQPAFKDDRDEFEYSPSFDFTLTFENVYTSETPSTADISGQPTAV